MYPTFHTIFALQKQAGQRAMHNSFYKSASRSSEDNPVFAASNKKCYLPASTDVWKGGGTRCRSQLTVSSMTSQSTDFQICIFWDTLLEKWSQQKKEKINFCISGGAVQQQGHPES